MKRKWGITILDLEPRCCYTSRGSHYRILYYCAATNEYYLDPCSMEPAPTLIRRLKIRKCSSCPWCNKLIEQEICIQKISSFENCVRIREAKQIIYINDRDYSTTWISKIFPIYSSFHDTTNFFDTLFMEISKFDVKLAMLQNIISWDQSKKYHKIQSRNLPTFLLTDEMSISIGPSPHKRMIILLKYSLNLFRRLDYHYAFYFPSHVTQQQKQMLTTNAVDILVTTLLCLQNLGFSKQILRDVITPYILNMFAETDIMGFRTEDEYLSKVCKECLTIVPLSKQPCRHGKIQHSFTFVGVCRNEKL